ncbi:MAG: TIGR02281 family clan AA aspartic protease [Rubrivivax sp.]
MLWLAAVLPAAAQSVSLAGTMGSKALLVVDGQTQVLAVGESARGVKLLKLQDGEALVEAAGRQQALRVGGAPAKLAGASVVTGGREIVIPAASGGHFVAQGAINGRSVQFMVDTGATTVALGQNEAERIGLDWKGGQQLLTQTANGTAVAHRVTLRSVRVGEVEVANVAAVVVPAPMPMVLLGNSFLGRFQMRRDNDVMRLELR